MQRHRLRSMMLLALGALAGCRGAAPAGTEQPPPGSFAQMQAQATQMMAQVKADHAALERDCPWPGTGVYQHTRSVNDPALKVPPIMTLYPDWVQGCAVLTFGLNEDGVPVQPTVVQSTSPQAGALALRLLARSEYATQPAADAQYMMRLGMEHDARGYVVLQESR